MKFTQIIHEPYSPIVQVISFDQDQENLDSNKETLGSQITLQNSIDLQQIYQFSQRSAIVTQQILIQPNFANHFHLNNNLKESREVQAQTFRVSRNFIPDPFDKVCFIKKNIQASNAISTCPMTPLKAEQNYQEWLHVENSLGQIRKENQTQRVQIFLQDDKQSDKLFHYKYRGPIPLKENKENTKKQSLIIKTYRQVKNRLGKSQEKPIQQKIKMKVEIKKQQNNRLKGPLITYDYNGQPISLKNNKKNTIYHSSSKMSQTIVMTPMAQNIVLPSTTNKARLQKRKARYFQNDQQKQNQRQYPNQQLVISEGSQFLRKIPKQIDQFRLFKDQEEDMNKKPLDKLSFSQFIENAKHLNHIGNRSTEVKQTKTKLGLSMVKEQKRIKKRLKRVHLNHGKMTTDEKIFERIFHFKPNCGDRTSEQTIRAKQVQDKAITRANRQKAINTLNGQHNSKVQKQKKKNVGKSLHILGMGSYIGKISKVLRKEIYRSLSKQQKTSIMRNSLKDSLQSGSAYYSPLEHNQSSRQKYEIRKRDKNQRIFLMEQGVKQSNIFQSNEPKQIDQKLKRIDGNEIRNKEKLKSRRSSKHTQKYRQNN